MVRWEFWRFALGALLCVAAAGTSAAAADTQKFFGMFGVGGERAVARSCENWLPVDVDRDRDCLDDGWEQWVAETHAPLVVWDENEPCPQHHTFFQVRPRGCVGPACSPGEVVITYVFAFRDDCGRHGFYKHRGDAETVRVFVGVLNAGQRTDPFRVVTYAHEGTATDHSTARFAQFLQWAGTHPIVYCSESKHAFYPTTQACESAVLFDIGIKKWREDCDHGPRLVALLSGNVGEPEHPLIGRLDRFGFQGEDVWANHFCGGYGCDTGPNIGSKWYREGFNLQY